MSFRYMRILVFFDLPTDTIEDQRGYRRFRKFLISNGFMMLQESVYVKLALNATAGKAIINLVKKNKPIAGLVQMLMITEKQYAAMELVVGESKSEVLNSTDRLVII